MQTLADRLATQETRKWQAHSRIAGSLTAALGLAALVLAVTFWRRSHNPVADTVLITAVGILELVLGFAFAMRQRWPRLLLWPLSIIHLVAFPVGTAIGGYVLWVMYNTRLRPTAPS